MSLTKIKETSDKGDHIFTTVDKFVFMEREEGMKEYMRRFALH